MIIKVLNIELYPYYRTQRFSDHEFNLIAEISGCDKETYSHLHVGIEFH